MASKLVIFVCIQMLTLNLAFSQILSRVGAGGCGCGCGGLPYLEQYLPLPAPCAQPSVVYDQPTTIIQDSTVANNLANALQLLVVSNLLSSTLPLEPSYDLVAPSALAPVAPLAPYGAPLAPYGAPLSLSSYVSPCGCGGCGGGCGCGQYPYNILY